MALSPLTGPVSTPPFWVGGNPAALPWPVQSSYQAQDPFGAYLLALSAPALAIMARTGYPVAGSVPAGPAGLDTLGAAAERGVAELGVALPQPDAGAEPEAHTPANVAIGPTTAPAGAADEAVASVDRRNPEAPAAASPDNAARAARIAAQATAGRAAQPLAGNPALLDPGRAGAPESWNLATDATAKYMGAGNLAQPAGETDQARAAAAYLAILNDIPAVSGVPSALGLAANSSNTPRGHRFGQAPGTQPVPQVPAMNGTAPTLDLVI